MGCCGGARLLGNVGGCSEVPVGRVWDLVTLAVVANIWNRHNIVSTLGKSQFKIMFDVSDQSPNTWLNQPIPCFWAHIRSPVFIHKQENATGCFCIMAQRFISFLIEMWAKQLLSAFGNALWEPPISTLLRFIWHFSFYCAATVRLCSERRRQQAGAILAVMCNSLKSGSFCWYVLTTLSLL